MGSSKLSCTPSAYDIARDVTATNGHVVYFLRQNNQDISQEYSGNIEWFVDDQAGEIIQDNRLFLNCDTHNENIQVKARFITDCGDEVLKAEDFTYPANICEPETPSPEPPVEPGPGPMTYCEEYKARKPGVESSPFFQTTLQRVQMPLNQLLFSKVSWMWEFDTGPAINPSRFFSADEQSQLGSFKGQLIGIPDMDNKYLTVPISIPEFISDVDMLITLSYGGELQRNWSPIQGGAARITLSPCSGDFRSPPSALNPSQDVEFSSRDLHSSSGVTAISIIVSDNPNPSLPFSTTGLHRIPKGKTAYLNLSYTNFLNGSLQSTCIAPIYDPNTETPFYGPTYRYDNYGCGAHTTIDKQCYRNGSPINCPGS